MWLQIIGLVIGIPAFIVFVLMTLLHDAVFAMRLGGLQGQEYPANPRSNGGRFLPPGI